MFRATPDIMRRFARQEDEGRGLILSLITIAACISIVAIGLILQDKGKENSLLFLHLGLAIVTSREMRRLSLIHGVLSFFFNTTIVAMMINIVAGSLA